MNFKSKLILLTICFIYFLCFFNQSVVNANSSKSLPVDFEELFENHGSIMLVLDAKTGKIMNVNKAAEEFYGFTKEKMLKMNIEQINILPYEDLKEEMEAAYKQKRNNFIFNHQLSNGTIKTVEVYSYPFVNEDAQLLYSVINDISDRQQLQKYITYRNYIIGTIMIILILILLSLIIYILRFCKARRKIELVEAENIAKDTFLANMSHELRTPLNVIFSSVQVLQSYYKNIDNNVLIEKKQNHIRVIKQNCYRLLRLIDNIIDITKIDANFFELKLKNQDIIGIVENIALSVSEHIKQKDISLIFDTEVEEKIIACDADTLERIILNLLSNAVKFTNTGGSIFVNIYDNKNKVIITVKDTGVGIPKEKLDIIFDRFSQVDTSLTRNHEGSGIGLSLVKSLVEKLNGTIKVESELNKGTEFTIELPSIQIDTSENTNTNIPESKSTNFVEKIHIEFSDIYK